MCNVFFSHCNLQCVYCQNYQISRNESCRVHPVHPVHSADLDCAHHHQDNAPGNPLRLEEVLDRICIILDQGITTLGFVTPSHQIPQMVSIIRALHRRGRYPIVVYNTSAYDRISSLQALADLIDIYLPDFKYTDADLARRWSDGPDYPAIATRAITEMIRQKGTDLELDATGQARKGVMIRHLVLPGHIRNSLNVLAHIKHEFSTAISVSLMAQYYPPITMQGHSPLDRKLTSREYQQVVQALLDLGFENGWIQERSSAECFRPDFEAPEPF